MTALSRATGCPLGVVTDGENTRGRSPDEVAREIWRKSQGGVQVYFIAFDTSPEKFAFLKEAGGADDVAARFPLGTITCVTGAFARTV